MSKCSLEELRDLVIQSGAVAANRVLAMCEQGWGSSADMAALTQASAAALAAAQNINIQGEGEGEGEEEPSQCSGSVC